MQIECKIDTVGWMPWDRYRGIGTVGQILVSSYRLVEIDICAKPVELKRKMCSFKLIQNHRKLYRSVITTISFTALVRG